METVEQWVQMNRGTVGTEGQWDNGYRGQWTQTMGIGGQWTQRDSGYRGTLSLCYHCLSVPIVPLLTLSLCSYCLSAKSGHRGSEGRWVERNRGTVATEEQRVQRNRDSGYREIVGSEEQRDSGTMRSEEQRDSW